jgi:ABC-type multidrug transport system fused ATPase/permease subunit
LADKTTGSLLTTMMEKVEATSSYITRYLPQMVLAVTLPFVIAAIGFCISWKVAAVWLVAYAFLPLLLAISGILAGFTLLAKRGKLTLRVQDVRQGNPLAREALLETEIDGRTVVFDLMDGYFYNDPAAVQALFSRADVVFKRSFCWIDPVNGCNKSCTLANRSTRYSELCNVDRLDRGFNRLFKLWYPLVWYTISSVDHVAFECSSKILEIRVYKFPNYFMVRCDLKKMSI